MILSIVTITMKDDEGLIRTLRSVARQLDRATIRDDIELIIVDGAARTETTEIARTILGERCSWTAILEGDGGIYAAQNKGLALCVGEYVQFLNGGDSYASIENGLGTVVSALRNERPFWLIAGARYDEVSNEGATIRNIPHSWWRHALGLQSHCHQACYFTTGYLRAIGGHRLDVGLAADFDLIMKCGLVESPYLLDQLLIRYQGGGLSAANGRQLRREAVGIRFERFNATGMAQYVIRFVSAFGFGLRVTKGAIYSTLDPPRLSSFLSRAPTPADGARPDGLNA